MERSMTLEPSQSAVFRNALLLAAALQLTSAAPAPAQPSPQPTVINVAPGTTIRATLEREIATVVARQGPTIRFVTFEGTKYVVLKQIPVGEPFWVEVLYPAVPAQAPRTVKLEWSGTTMRADIAPVAGNRALFRSTRAFYTMQDR
jgi:hypothetical protein